MQYLLILSILIVALTIRGDDSMTEEECSELGFNKKSLQCSTCAKLNSFGLEELYTDCDSCCTKEKAVSHDKYPVAYIEYCDCNIARFPQAQAFIKGGMGSQWGSQLKVRHVRGVLPTLIMRDSKGKAQKTLNIESWNTDTITEFLNDWLE
uniref:Sep15_SelM domain-containing protein n=1 Tax=Rhabditophanes sp. KR3021 TaxID=114890 RepID=A0AC35TMP3_9BILA